jgi:hypothetical protein
MVWHCAGEEQSHVAGNIPGDHAALAPSNGHGGRRFADKSFTIDTWRNALAPVRSEAVYGVRT